MPIIRVRGRSMTPTLHPGDFLWIRPTHHLRRGQIVLIKRQKNKLYIKRIIGLPNEHLSIRNGRVYINGEMLPEPYVLSSAYVQPKADQRIDLPPSTYFTLGDARDDSLDSRQFGPVNAAEIVGAAIWKLWPPKPL